MACSETDIYREKVARMNIPNVIVAIAANSYGDKNDIACKILALLSYHENSRTFIHTQPNFMSSVIELILKTEEPSVVESLAMTIFYSVIDYPFFDQIDVKKLVSTFESLQLLNEQLGAQTGAHSQLVMQYLVGAVRELCKHEFLVAEIATPATVSLFNRALALVMDDKNMIYDIAAALSSLVKYGSDHRVNLSSSRYIVPVLCALLKKENIKTTLELSTNVLTSFCLDAKSRPNFVMKEIIELFVAIYREAEAAQYASFTKSYLYNGVSAVYALSKIPRARDISLQVGVDAELEKIPVNDNPEMKSNVSRTIKNLSSEAAEALEEGTITSLIAMSLEGKKSQLKEDVLPAEELTQRYKSAGVPSFFLSDGDFSAYSPYLMPYEATLGGSAGKGPPAPDPPSMDSESTDAFCTPEYKEEIANEASMEEGKSKMAFAKMHVPSELRNSYLLTDEDFKREEERLEKAAMEKEDAETNGEVAVGESLMVVADEGADEDYQTVSIDPIPDSSTPMDMSPKSKVRKNKSFRSNSKQGSTVNTPNQTPQTSARGEKSELNSPKTSPKSIVTRKKLAPVSTKQVVDATDASKLGLYS